MLKRSLKRSRLETTTRGAPVWTSPRRGRIRVGAAGAVLALWALLAVGLPGAARAATIGYSDQLSLADADISGTLSVPRFDVSLGSLTEVRWTVAGTVSSVLGILNNAPGPVSGTAYTRVDYDLDSTVLSLGASPDFEVPATTGIVTLGAGESTIRPVNGSVTITGTELPAAGFLGPGTVDVGFATTTSFGASGFGGDLSIGQSTDVGLELTIEYDFVPVPEPSTAMLMGLGLAALASACPRRQAPSR